MSFNDLQVLHLAGLIETALRTERTQVAAGKYIAWTPLVDDVVIVVATGAVRSLAVSGTTATVTVIAGTTTYAQVAGDWALSAPALALAAIDGDSGIIAVGYTGETLNLGEDVGVVVRAPLASIPASGECPVLAVYRRGEVTSGHARTGREVVLAEIGIEYFLGREERQHGEDAWSDLPGVVSKIRRILQQKKHASYLSGATLASLADIQDLTVNPSQYRPALPDGETSGAYPAAALSVTVKYEDTGWTTRTTLTAIDLSHNTGTGHTVPATSFGSPIESHIPK